MRILVVPLLLAVCSGGCGYKGPLYVPAREAAKEKPGTIVVPEPAPERPVPAQSAPPPR